jgi:hypothetical protein
MSKDMITPRVTELPVPGRFGRWSDRPFSGDDEWRRLDRAAGPVERRRTARPTAGAPRLRPGLVHRP